MSRFMDKAADIWAGEKADNDALNAEVERLGSLTLQQLAAEVMVKGLARTDRVLRPTPTWRSSVAHFTQPYQGRDYDQEADARLMEMVAEGVQVLEHACLVRPGFHGQGGDHSVYYNLGWGATRLGRAAVDQHAVERILSGGSL